MTALTGRDEQLRALKRVILTEPPALQADGAHILEFEGREICRTLVDCDSMLGSA
jgi:hypothetical protein